ncbi:MAG TPA: zf-HC2 domain-containing protein [Verrucomicrobiae bacterium]|nr:zf-HC2 domain-containing protein [Verrucomicrobiae bacterium]
MICADLEVLICDYVDGTLDAARKAAVERHLAECAACAELARDSAAAVAFMEKAADVEPPQELITRILFDAPWNVEKAASKKRTWLAALLGPVLQPRIVMGMAMTMLSLSMMAKFIGPARPLRAADLKPAAIWNNVQNQAEYGWNRTVVFFEHLKVVYQIQTVLQKLQAQQEEDQPAETAPKPDDHKLPVRTAPGTGSQAAPSNPSGGSK